MSPRIDLPRRRRSHESYAIGGMSSRRSGSSIPVVSLTLEIPDDFAARLETRREEAEAQLHLELAIALYRKGELPVARAASLAELKHADFEELLRQLGITVPSTLDDLKHDSAYASGRR